MSLTKYKSVPPGETVEKIKGILKEKGIETQESWVDSGVGSICSVRISIKGTAIGQNGKGTDHDFAMASGYAEFMERLQSGYLLPEGLSAMADRVWRPIEKVKEAGGPLLEGTLKRIRQVDGGFDFLPLDTEEYLRLWSFSARDGKMALIPFQRLEKQETYYLPEILLRSYYFTNGSCAGNTREEALVQGMSEIAERYSAARILTERLTPPQLPEEILAPYPLLSSAVKTIKENGRYTLRLLDASLGIGLPVMAMALMDRETGKVVLRFGAYPRLEIALERCLTEILQGRHIQRLESAPVFDFAKDAQATGVVNRFNFVKAAFGDVPVEFFGSVPSWEYSPFTEAPESLPGQIQFMEKLFNRLGWDLYVRDCSFLGFPTFQLVVPGVSMVMDFGAERLGERRRMEVFRAHLSRLSCLSDPRAAQVREDIKDLSLIKRGFLLENTFAFLSGVPLTPTLLGVAVDASILAALCHISFQECDQAAALLMPYCFGEGGRMRGVYPLVQLLESKNSQKVYELMEQLCPEGFAQRAREVLKDPFGALVSLPCPDCTSCTERESCKADLLLKACQALQIGEREEEGRFPFAAPLF